MHRRLTHARCLILIVCVSIAATILTAQWLAASPSSVWRSGSAAARPSSPLLPPSVLPHVAAAPGVVLPGEQHERRRELGRRRRRPTPPPDAAATAADARAEAASLARRLQSRQQSVLAELVAELLGGSEEHTDADDSAPQAADAPVAAHAARAAAAAAVLGATTTAALGRDAPRELGRDEAPEPVVEVRACRRAVVVDAPRRRTTTSAVPSIS